MGFMSNKKNIHSSASSSSQSSSSKHTSQSHQNSQQKHPPQPNQEDPYESQQFLSKSHKRRPFTLNNTAQSILQELSSTIDSLDAPSRLLAYLRRCLLRILAKESVDIELVSLSRAKAAIAQIRSRQTQQLRRHSSNNTAATSTTQISSSNATPLQQINIQSISAIESVIDRLYMVAADKQIDIHFHQSSRFIDHIDLFDETFKQFMKRTIQSIHSTMTTSSTSRETQEEEDEINSLAQILENLSVQPSQNIANSAIAMFESQFISNSVEQKPSEDMREDPQAREEIQVEPIRIQANQREIISTNTNLNDKEESLVLRYVTRAVPSIDERSTSGRINYIDVVSDSQNPNDQWKIKYLP